MRLTDLIFVKEDEKSVRTLQRASLDLDETVVVVFDLPNRGCRVGVAGPRKFWQSCLDENDVGLEFVDGKFQLSVLR